MKVKVPAIKTHVDGTSPKSKKEIFVFGSNLGGIHGGGAARAAHEKFGAVWGQAEGLQGRSYAVPTKNATITATLSKAAIKRHVDRFNRFVADNPEMKFFITRVGCVLAGLKDSDIAPMFKAFPNCNYPEEWADLLTVENK